MKRTTRILAAAALALAAGTACAQATIDHNKALAGGITPGDTPGYPITLSVPGHYKLTSNLAVPAFTRGIEISARGVTLDLNGFTVAGPNVCVQNPSTRDVSCTYTNDYQSVGIFTLASQGIEPIVIRNGTVRGFGYTGVSTSGNVRIDGVNALHNTSAGIKAVNDPLNSMHISNAAADLNGGDGIVAPHGLIERSRATSNGGDGIVGSTVGVIAHDCVTRLNRNVGLRFIAARGSATAHNGINRSSVISLGGNVDGVTPF